MRGNLGKGRRVRGFSLSEGTATLGVLCLGLLALGAVQLKAVSASPSGHDFRQAVRIAHEQMELAQLLSPEQVPTTDGFVPAAWIDVLGYAPGELPIRVDRADPAGSAGPVFVVYTIQCQVGRPKPGAERAIDVQIQWTGSSGRTRSYSASGSRSL